MLLIQSTGHFIETSSIIFSKLKIDNSSSSRIAKYQTLPRTPMYTISVHISLLLQKLSRPIIFKMTKLVYRLSNTFRHKQDTEANESETLRSMAHVICTFIRFIHQFSFYSIIHITSMFCDLKSQFRVRAFIASSVFNCNGIFLAS